VKSPTLAHVADNARKSVQPASELHSVALERHHSVLEIAELWAMSEKSVRRLFAGEHGVLEWGTHESARKRGYLNLRIPESVLIRVHQRRQRACRAFTQGA
jgi:transcriptional regulator GlxA family with amidase domain